MRVLILEDEPDIAATIERGLQMIDSSLTIHCAARLTEAKSLIESNDFDVALVDLTLPDAVDADAIVELRRLAPKLPLVALTGVAFDTLAISLARFGVQDYLEKGKTNLTRIHQVLRLAAIRQHRENRLADSARHDPLTNTLNRRELESQIEKAMGHAERNGQVAAIVLCDIDNFKAINDTFGHSAGDAVLKLFAERLRAITRVGDSIARLGGDEFVVVLEGIPDRSAVLAAVEKLVTATNFETAFHGRSIQVATSMGISVFPTDARTAERLLECADIAMYRGKKDARAAYTFYVGD